MRSRYPIQLLIAALISFCVTAPAAYAQKRSHKKHKTQNFDTAPPQAGSGFAITLKISDAHGAAIPGEASFGVNTMATDCVDQNLGEAFLPPIPPNNLPDMRFVTPHPWADSCWDLGISSDIRKYTSPTQIDTFKYQFQVPNELYPITISWDPVKPVYRDSVRLLDTYKGAYVNLDMREGSSVKIAEAIPHLIIIARHPIVGSKNSRTSKHTHKSKH